MCFLGRGKISNVRTAAEDGRRESSFGEGQKGAAEGATASYLKQNWKG